MSVQYEYNGHEIYWGKRSSTDEIELGFFKNTVYFNESDRTATIRVSGSWEYDEESDYVPEKDEEKSENDCPYSEEKILENNNDFVYRDVFHLSVRNKNHGYNSDYKNDWLSNINVTFPVGEGLLDFCYSSFKDGIEWLYFILRMTNAMEKFTPDFFTEDEIKEMEEHRNDPPEIHNSEERFERDLNSFDRTMYYVRGITRSSIYTEAFPPLMYETDIKTLKRYIYYINEIREEMLRRIIFVFDDEFFPEELLKMKPHERFFIYSEIFDIPRDFERTEHFIVTPFTDKTTLESSLIPIEEIKERLGSHKSTDTKSTLEEIYDLDAGRIALHYHVPKFMAVGYDCGTVHDMLELEFSKMLEYGIKLHKCKNCGRYFIVKGNYAAEYCDRVRSGQNKTCQQIAAQKKYEEKLHNNEAVSLFRKYYKRYYARTKAGTLKPDTFRQWNYRACEIRDKCLNGKISASEFEEWLIGSFKNRSKK